MAQEMTHVSAAAAAGLVGLISIANGSGRLLWAWLSDFIGRRQVFMTMFLVQAVIFLMLAQVESFRAMAVLSFCRPSLLRRGIRHDARVCGGSCSVRRMSDRSTA